MATLGFRHDDDYTKSDVMVLGGLFDYDWREELEDIFVLTFKNMPAAMAYARTAREHVDAITIETNVYDPWEKVQLRVVLYATEYHD